MKLLRKGKLLGRFSRMAIAGAAVSIVGLVIIGLGAGQLVSAAAGAPWSPDVMMYEFAAGGVIGALGFTLLVLAADPFADADGAADSDLQRGKRPSDFA
jgi:hypothetical protein